MSADLLDQLVSDLRAGDPARELRLATPGPEAIRARSARPRGRRGAILRAAGGVAAVGAGAVIVGILFLRTGDDPAPGSAASVSILDRPATARDRLPEWVAKDRRVVGARIVGSSTRLAGVFGARRVWVAAAANGRICAVDALAAPPPGAGDGAGIACRSRSELRAGLFIAPLRYQRAGTVDILGIAPDDVESVVGTGDRSTVRGNVFVLRRVVSWKPVVGSGPGVTKRAWTGITPPPPVRRGSNRPLPVGLLARPSVPRGRLPTRIARAVDDEPGRRAWRTVIPGTNDALWVLTPGRPGDRGVVVSRDAVGGWRWPTARQPVNWSSSFRGSPNGAGTFGASGIVADGYDTVTAGGQSAPIRNNTFGIQGTQGPEPIELVISGPRGRWSDWLPGAGANFVRSVIPAPR